MEYPIDNFYNLSQAKSACPAVAFLQFPHIRCCELVATTLFLEAIRTQNRWCDSLRKTWCWFEVAVKNTNSTGVDDFAVDAIKFVGKAANGLRLTTKVAMLFNKWLELNFHLEVKVDLKEWGMIGLRRAWNGISMES